jgi:hypothetical protein
MAAFYLPLIEIEAFEVLDVFEAITKISEVRGENYVRY